MLKNILFHLMNYTNFSLRMNRQPYILITLLHGLLLMPFVVHLMPQESEVVIDPSLPERMAHMAYGFLLLPFHVKRMKDLGWLKWQVDVGVLCMYVPSVLGAMMSDSGLAIISPLLMLIVLAKVALSIYLVLMKGENGRNAYGDDPL